MFSCPRSGSLLGKTGKESFILGKTRITTDTFNDEFKRVEQMENREQEGKEL